MPIHFSWINKFDSDLKGLYHRTFTSHVIGKKIGYGIYIPEELMGEHMRVPVLYWLHGKGGNESIGPNLKIPQIINNALLKKKVKPFIAVFVNGASFSMYCDSYDKKIPVESYIVNDLIPHIDHTYATLANHRSIEGFSMGGFGALRLALKFWKIFESVLTYGGSFHDLESVSKNRPEVFQRMFSNHNSYFQENSPYVIAKNNARFLKNHLRIRTVVGSNDFTLENNEKIWNLLDRLGIGYEKILIPNTEHDCRPYYEKEGLNGFRFHFQ